MSSPKPTNPLQRAHTLSLEASTILRPSSVPLPVLAQASTHYREAIDLYEKAQQDAEGRGGDEVNTLKMLVIQHRKLLKDVERRIAVAQKDQSSQNARIANPDSIASGRPIQRRSMTESAAPARMADHSGRTVRGPTLTSMQPSELVNPLPSRSIPPFALRPSSSSSSTLPQHPSNPVEPSLSPLYSSSSTSSSIEESYIHFGSTLNDNSDPFSKFWNMLENMIEEVSGPVMFATAPVVTEAPNKDEEKLKRDTIITKKDKDKGKGKGKEERPEESFYMIKPSRSRSSLMGRNLQNESTDEEEEVVQRPGSNNGGPSKTAEELLLENESLKTALDSLALHAESVDNTNKTLKKQLEEREKGFKILMEQLKKEAGRVKAVGQEVWKSQLLSNSLIGTSISRLPIPIPTPGSGVGAGQSNILGKDSNKDDLASKKRIKDLEDELRSLKTENEKQKETIVRYKERFEKIKSNAKAKKEAKLAAAQPDKHNEESSR